MKYVNSRAMDEIYPKEIQCAIKELNSGKACGIDSVYSEHIKHGGKVLEDMLVVLFNQMYRYSYVPVKLKRGLIITLYKGGNKKKTEPSSYRAITLSSSILKLYECVLVKRLKHKVNITIHELQSGFQESMCCPMTTY